MGRCLLVCYPNRGEREQRGEQQQRSSPRWDQDFHLLRGRLELPSPSEVWAMWEDLCCALCRLKVY